MRRLVGLMFVCALVASGFTAVPAQGQEPERLTNLDHIDFLGDTVTPPTQKGHTTYRLDEEPSLRVLWTYAEPDGSGSYKRIGGGTYDPDTDTYGQGAFNTDDLTRAAVVYLRHWRQFGDDHSRDAAYGLLRAVTYMQSLSPAEHRGNFVLWMQPDGTLNPSAEPRELPDPSDSGDSYWLARGIWALGEGYAAFKDADPAFASFLEERLELGLDALDRQVLVHYGETQTVDGLELPAWLIADGADATAEAVLGLSAYVSASGSARARDALAKLAEGVARMRPSDTSRFPFGAILPWAQSRSVWHGWGDQMSGSLARASVTLGDPALADVAVGETGTFTPHLLVQGGPDQGWLPAPADRAQIAYGADSTLQNLLAVAEATGRQSFRQLAGISGAWYFGNNPAGAQMYDPPTGRTFDGINGDRSINRNSGAESTIHGLLSMLALDANPDVRESAGIAERTEQVTWQVVQAESGRLSGDATVVAPPSAWTGESLWTGDRYVDLGPSGRVGVSVDLPIRDRYRVLPVFLRQEVPERSVGTRHAVNGEPFGIAWHGGAGAQGVTAIPGYLDVDNLGSRKEFAAGRAEILSGYVGEGKRAALDALLVQPEVEHIVLRGEDGGQALLRNWSNERRVRTVNVGDGPVTAYSYDAKGVLVETRVGLNGSVDALIEPSGFTTIAS